MSEIKGQLFGILLVVAVFGVVGTTLVTAFKNAADDVGEKITEEVNLSAEEGTNSYETTNLIDNSNLLKF